MTKIKDIYNFIDSIAPFNTAMDFDNVGLLVGDENEQVKNALLALDITLDVIDEAVQRNAQLIISHHPVIFNPIKKLSPKSAPYALANNGIAAICAHTNLDMAKGGVNTCLAKSLNLTKLSPLSIYKENNYNKIVVFAPSDYVKTVSDAMTSLGAGKIGEYKDCTFTSLGNGSFIPLKNSNPFIGKANSLEVVEETKIEVICPPSKTNAVINAMKKVHPYEEPAFDVFETSAIKEQTICGLIGLVSNKTNAKDFASLVRDSLNCNGVRYVEGNRGIERVAVCSGSGGNFIFDAIALGADAFVTGEIKHHEILAAQQAGITVVDAGHFCTEDIVINNLKEKLENNFNKVNFIKASALIDTFTYIKKE